MESIIILFDGPHLAFSPTPTQLYDELSKKYDVTILAQDPKNYTGQAIRNRKVLYYKYYGVKGRLLYKVLFGFLSLINKEAKIFKKYGLNYRDYFFKFKFIKDKLKRIKNHRIICIDIANLFYCSLLKERVDFLSLELTKDENLLRSIDLGIVDCVIIQSKERFEYLFKDRIIRTFFVQNAPNYRELQIDLSRRKDIIYSGSSIDGLGFYHCLDFLNKFKNETMVVQGAFYPKDRERVEREYSDLLKEGRLVIESKYLENDEVVDYISGFQVGFCFYNFDDPFIKSNYFNYFTAPSGKMFKYLAAGVPVVCSNILGFQFINDFKCGVLIDNLGEDDIYNAILTIRADYRTFVENAKKAAMHFSFDHAILPYLEFIGKK